MGIVSVESPGHGTEDPGTSSGDYFVGLFDILGFSSYVERTPLSDLHKTLDSQRTAAVLAATDAEVLEGRVVAGKPRVGFARFSDTILLWTLRPGPAEAAKIVKSAALLIGTSAVFGLPVRGAISYGEFLAKPAESLYAGRSIVEASREEATQDWIGGVMTDSAIDASGHSAIDALTRDGWLFGFPTPMKSGPVRTRSCIGWPRNISAKSAAEIDRWLRQLDPSPEWDGERKIRNALTFFADYRSVHSSRFNVRVEARAPADIVPR